MITIAFIKIFETPRIYIFSPLDDDLCRQVTRFICVILRHAIQVLNLGKKMEF